MTSSLADGDWHRLHPATPLLRGGIFAFAALGFVIANLRERLIDIFFGVPMGSGDPLDEIYRRGAVGWALLVVAAILIAIVTGFYLSWRMHTFRVNDEIVEVRSGIVFRSNRKARLDRIQGVNIERALVPRLFGAARLEVSGAGQDANVQLAYLGSARADELRRDILRLASGARRAAEPEGEAAAEPEPEREPGPGIGERLAAEAGSSVGDFARGRVSEFLAPELDPDAAPPESVVRIPPGRLLGSIVLNGFTVVLIIGGIALVVSGAVSDRGWLPLAVLPGLLGAAGFYVSRLTRSLRFSIAGTPDGVRVGFGLLSTSNETLPPGRIHAIGISQPLLWRPFGWWQVRINKAGRSSNQGAAGEASTTVLPVGTVTDVARVLELVLPGYDAEEQRALIDRGMRSKGGDDGYVNAPRRAAWLRPFSWRRTGYTVSAGAAVLRRGIVSRELLLVPLARVQSVGIDQGPIQRRLRLASARLHTVAGPVTASLSVVDAAEAVRLFESIAAGAVSHAISDTSHRWNHTTGAPE